MRPRRDPVASITTRFERGLMPHFVSEPTFWGILAGAVLVGGLAGWFLRGLAESFEVRRLRTSHKKYHREVTEHFRETARLVGRMTEDYRAVYRHLAEGAERLAEGETGPPGLRDQRLLSRGNEDSEAG